MLLFFFCYLYGKVFGIKKTLFYLMNNFYKLFSFLGTVIQSLLHYGLE